MQNELRARPGELVEGQVHTPLEDGPMLTKCKRVHSHVYCTVLNGSFNSSWSVAMIDKVRAWEAKILRFAFRQRMGPRKKHGVEYRNRTAQSLRKSWRKIGLPLLTEKIASKIWTAVTWAVYEGDVPIMRALLSMLGWRTTAWWKSQASWCMAWDPTNVGRWEHKVGFPQQRDTVGKVGW